jgi:hypothetical protein
MATRSAGALPMRPLADRSLAHREPHMSAGQGQATVLSVCRRLAEHRRALAGQRMAPAFRGVASLHRARVARWRWDEVATRRPKLPESSRAPHPSVDSCSLTCATANAWHVNRAPTATPEDPEAARSTQRAAGSVLCGMQRPPRGWTTRSLLLMRRDAPRGLPHTLTLHAAAGVTDAGAAATHSMQIRLLL